LFSLYFRYYTHTLFATRLIINKSTMGGFEVGECPRISPFLKYNGPWLLRGLGSIIVKEWRVTWTFCYAYYTLQ